MKAESFSVPLFLFKNAPTPFSLLPIPKESTESHLSHCTFPKGNAMRKTALSLSTPPPLPTKRDFSPLRRKRGSLGAPSDRAGTPSGVPSVRNGIALRCEAVFSFYMLFSIAQMLLEHFFCLFGFEDKYLSYAVIADVNSLMPLLLLPARIINVNP